MWRTKAMNETEKRNNEKKNEYTTKWACGMLDNEQCATKYYYWPMPDGVQSETVYNLYTNHVKWTVRNW